MTGLFRELAFPVSGIHYDRRAGRGQFDAYRLTVYDTAVIKSFRCPETKRLFTTGKTRRFAAFQAVAERKLAQLDAAETLEFLRSPSGNRLEALSGDRHGQHSIRVNGQFRLCFRWTADGPADVEIVDYH